jgi:hypothetical protein
MQVYKITASQLASLLQILGALVADYIQNPKKPMSPELVPLVKTSLDWKDLPGLRAAVSTCVKGGDKLQALFDLGTELKEALPVFKNNRDYSTPELKMLSALRSYLSTDSETALNYIRKNAVVFNSPALAQVFVPPIPPSDTSALQKVVKSLVGRIGTHLTMPEVEMLKTTNPTGYERYVTLRKEHNLSFKAALTNYVRQTGKKLADYEMVYQEMYAQGFEIDTAFLSPVGDSGFESFGAHDGAMDFLRRESF